jgi:hypothetical protein
MTNGEGVSMTEAEWLACEDPVPMLYFLGDGASDRKSRLFAVACCRRCRLQSVNESERAAVDIGVRYADGWASESERLSEWELIQAAKSQAVEGQDFERAAWLWVLQWPVLEKVLASSLTGLARSAPGAGNLLRCVFGLACFRPPRALPRAWLAWNGGGISQLAEDIYGNRSFDRLPILADALEDAGCTDREILDHCRGPGPHVRGCWVVDLILDKQ